MTFIRWAAFLPCAVAAAWVAWLVVSFVNRLTIFLSGFDPKSFLFNGYSIFLASAAMGAAFVYVGARVAPAHHKRVAFALVAVGFVASGFALNPAIFTGDYWAVWSGASALFGLGAVAYAIYSGELVVEPQQCAPADVPGSRGRG